MSWLSLLWNLLSRGVPGLVRLVGSVRVWLTRRKWGNWLMYYLGGSVGSFIKRAMEFLGISYVAYTWGAPALTQYVAGPLLGLPTDYQQLLSMTRLDDAITVMLSAVIYRVSLAVTVTRNPTWWARSA